MLEKIKSYVTSLLTALTAILLGLLYFSRKKNEQLEGDIVLEKSKAVLEKTESDMRVIDERADSAIAAFNAAKSEFDKSQSTDVH